MFQLILSEGINFREPLLEKSIVAV